MPQDKHLRNQQPGRGLQGGYRRPVPPCIHSAARVWLEQRAALLEAPVERILEALTSRSPRSRELRQNTPFAGVLSDEQRQAVLRGFAAAHHERDAP